LPIAVLASSLAGKVKYKQPLDARGHEERNAGGQARCKRKQLDMYFVAKSMHFTANEFRWCGA
jgi:hypothetical protein